jgi:hypothetical protein
LLQFIEAVTFANKLAKSWNPSGDFFDASIRERLETVPYNLINQKNRRVINKKRRKIKE